MVREQPMGFIHADVTIRGPGGERIVKMLVDTGATLSWVPEPLARELGARELGVIPIRLADNTIVHRPYGELEVEILGRKATRLIVFAHDDEEPLVGVDTLEGLLLEADPIEKRLKPLPHALALRGTSRDLLGEPALSAEQRGGIFAEDSPLRAVGQG